MKAGTDNRKKVIAAIVLACGALAVGVWQFSGWFGGFSSSAAAPSASTLAAPDPVPANLPARHGTAAKPKKNSEEASLDPTLHLDLLKSSEDTKYTGTGRNIFRVFVEPPPRVVAPVVTSQAPAAAQPYVPPPPPPIPLTFYGFATPQGGAKRVFLAKKEDVFIAKEGDIVDRRYKVVRISPNAVEILDVLSNNRQSIPLTQG
ncbi:MAG TPA: hypothetical protein VF133_02415 [Terriglobales bacterium]